MVKVAFHRFASAVAGQSFKASVIKGRTGRKAKGFVSNFFIRQDQAGWQNLGYVFKTIRTAKFAISRVGADAEFYTNLNSYKMVSRYATITLYKANNQLATLWRRI